MAFNKFTKNVLNVSALPDKVQNQAQQLKLVFDQAGVDIKEALNALISELEASTSASNLGADVSSVTAKTVQAVLNAFETAISNRYTKLESDTLLSTGTNDLVADLDVNLTTGVITVTKKDGTVQTFDTALEKVPADFKIVELGGSYVLQITNVDGTTTEADITNFMNIYNFNNSDNIVFEVTGEGTEKTVTANIKANSIGLDKLSLTFVSTIEGYVRSASDSAIAAKTSETNAKASENVAVAKANEASASATSAELSASTAEYWAKQTQGNAQGGDMLISIYDTNENGIVDNAEKLGGNLPEYYAKSSDLINNMSVINTALDGKAPSAHSHSASDVSSGTLAGQVVANASAVANYGTSQVRNIKAQTTDLTAGTSTLATGDIVFVYE